MTFREWIGLSKTPRYEDARWLGPLLFGVVVLIGTGLLALVLFRSFEALASGTGELRSYLYFLVALIGLPFVIWRSIVAQAQATTAAQGLITERFTKAVEQLGAEKTVKKDGEETTIPNLEVRLGGIYALERIAQDSLRDHITIMEVLCAYIRENAVEPTEFEKNKKGQNILRPPRVDIQAALTVIGRRGKDRLAHEANPPDGKPPFHLDLRGCWLAKADLDGAILGPVELDYANLTGAALNGAILAKAQLRGTNLTEAQMSGVNLTDAQISGTNLTVAWLENANLTKARLIGADLTRAWLVKVDLTSATLWESKTRFAAARFADLSNTDIFDHQLTDFFGDSTTILPDGVSRPIHWHHYENSFEFYGAWQAACEEAGLP
ncbi:pentapeptide repeat-containing protein [Pontivivens nitratireducens]|uniref:pentapeptide repeat-containing protein n=1 Tax=Pontivivens nitratireducens TaxID=2758038 RepID=UPI00163A4B7B|nr:pentapeptide repeat-containing protein [Pontibrevibacter nitratireducens]